MNSKAFVSIFIIIIVCVATITVFKLRNFPDDGECCKDITDPKSSYCYQCENYNFIEKVIYVWRFE